MCANYELIKRSQAIQLGLFEPTFDYKADIYPGYDCPLIFSTGDAIEWREVKFGLVPKWAKDLKICRNTYNARTETVHEKPSFRNAWAKSQFALIPVQTIFEPRYTDDDNDVTDGYIQVSFEELRKAMNLIEDKVLSENVRQIIMNRECK